MKSVMFLKCACVSLSAIFLSGCLMRHTVTENGEVVEKDYKFERPLKNAIERSE